MGKFIIYELQNGNSVKPGDKIKVKNLAAAKKYATKNQTWVGSVLKIQQNGETIAAKGIDGWICQ